MKRIMDKKGLASETMFQIGALVFGVVVLFVMLAQLTGSGLLTSGSAEENASTNLVGNLTTGVNTFANKIPTFFTIIVAVILIGFVLILWVQYKRSGMTSGGQL